MDTPWFVWVGVYFLGAFITALLMKVTGGDVDEDGLLAFVWPALIIFIVVAFPFALVLWLADYIGGKLRGE
jgi:hypothetical protein